MKNERTTKTLGQYPGAHMELIRRLNRRGNFPLKPAHKRNRLRPLAWLRRLFTSSN